MKTVPRDGLESGIDFGIGAGIQDLKVQVGGARRLLQVLKLSRSRRKGRIDEDSELGCLREEIAQQTQPLGLQGR